MLFTLDLLVLTWTLTWVSQNKTMILMWDLLGLGSGLVVLPSMTCSLIPDSGLDLGLGLGLGLVGFGLDCDLMVSVWAVWRFSGCKQILFWMI